MDEDSLMDCYRAHSQEEGQDEQGEMKELGGGPLALLSLPGPHGLLALGSQAIHQATPIHQAMLMLKPDTFPLEVKNLI